MALLMLVFVEPCAIFLASITELVYLLCYTLHGHSLSLKYNIALGLSGECVLTSSRSTDWQDCLYK